MNALQYLAVGLAVVTATITPFKLAKAIRCEQKYHIFELLVTDLVMVCVVVETAFPVILVSAPRTVRWLAITVLLLWIANFFGVFRRLFNPAKATISERNQP